MSCHPPFPSGCLAAAWEVLPFALQQFSLCSHSRAVGVSLLLFSLPSSILPGGSDVSQTVQFSAVPVGFLRCFKACQETSRTQVSRGDVAHWSTKACNVICTTAEVAQSAKKVLAILNLIVLSGEDIKPTPIHINRCPWLFLLCLNSSHSAVMEVTECPRTSA